MEDLFESAEQRGLYALTLNAADTADIAGEALDLLGQMDSAHCFRDSLRRTQILQRKSELEAKLKELINRAS